MTATYTVPTTGNYGTRQSGVVRHHAGDVIDLALASKLDMPNARTDRNTAAALADAVAMKRATWTSVHASVEGLGVGMVPDGETYVEVGCDDANHIATLPHPSGVTSLYLRAGGTGYDLRSHDPETIAINAGTGVAAESPIAANTLVFCSITDAAYGWGCSVIDEEGVLTPIAAAATP